MIIIAFCDKTSKSIPRIICRKIKHVAPICVHDDKIVMHQFVTRNNVKKIVLHMRDLKILQQYGWRFLYLNGVLNPEQIKPNSMTCVSFTKSAIGIKNWKIQTPYAMYKYLSQP